MNNVLSENKILKNSNRKKIIDKIMFFLFLFIAVICASVILVTIGVVLIKGLTPFFKSYETNNGLVKPSFVNFLFGFTWTSHGAFYLLINTIYAVILSLVISIPVSILTALFITRIAPKTIGEIFKSGIEVLSSIPSIIFGLFGQMVICPMVNNFANLFNYQTAGGASLLSGIIVLALMSIPTITVVSITSIQAVDKKYIEGSVAMGATNSETNFKVVLTGASSGIISGIILGVGRALGEATAISLVIGNSLYGPTFSLFNTSSTLTTIMMLGLTEASGLEYDIKFSLGIYLMLVIVITNFTLNYVKNRIANPYKKEIWLKKAFRSLIFFIKTKFTENKNEKD
ncbi:MAG TPA: phosphate ABC transporter permease subunit PstC [Firmicutes bacterium]|nr:phosphate ABC transporter permease subunit PstC [Bacillota bacterium]